MNKKVLRTMIYLVVAFLIGLYVIKLFFPVDFAMVISNEAFILFGNLVDTNLFLQIAIGCLTSFITYWLYICAVTRKWYLNYKEIIAVCVVIVISQILFSFEETSTIASGLSLISLVIIPLIDNAKLKDVAIVFSVHAMTQILSTSIRDLPFLLNATNSIIVFFMAIECYFWLLLFYLYFNYKKGDKE